jgi:hypothetical protein
MLLFNSTHRYNLITSLSWVLKSLLWDSDTFPLSFGVHLALIGSSWCHALVPNPQLLYKKNKKIGRIVYRWSDVHNGKLPHFVHASIVKGNQKTYKIKKFKKIRHWTWCSLLIFRKIFDIVAFAFHNILTNRRRSSLWKDWEKYGLLRLIYYWTGSLPTW